MLQPVYNVEVNSLQLSELFNKSEKLFQDFCKATNGRNYPNKLKSLVTHILLEVSAEDYDVSVYSWEGENVLEVRYLQLTQNRGIYINCEMANYFTVYVNVAHSLKQKVFGENAEIINASSVIEYIQNEINTK